MLLFLYPARVSAKGTSRRVYPARVSARVRVAAKVFLKGPARFGEKNIQCSEAFGWDGKGSVLRKHLLNRTFLPSNAV